MTSVMMKVLNLGLANKVLHNEVKVLVSSALFFFMHKAVQFFFHQCIELCA